MQKGTKKDIHNKKKEEEREKSNGMILGMSWFLEVTSVAAVVATSPAEHPHRLSAQGS